MPWGCHPTQGDDAGATHRARPTSAQSICTEAAATTEPLAPTSSAVTMATGRNRSRSPLPRPHGAIRPTPGGYGHPGRPPDESLGPTAPRPQPTGLPITMQPSTEAHVLPPGRPPDESASSSTGGPAPSRNRSGSARPMAANSVARVSGRPPDPSRVQLRVNGAALDPSHSFGFYRGIYWCWRCQGVASSKPRTLAKPCTSMHRPAKLRPAVSQLRNRVLPSNIQQYGWPLPEGSLPHPGLSTSLDGGS